MVSGNPGDSNTIYSVPTRPDVSTQAESGSAVRVLLIFLVFSACMLIAPAGAFLSSQKGYIDRESCMERQVCRESI